MYPFLPGFFHSTFYLWNSSILLLIVLLQSFAWLCSVPLYEYSTIHLSILLLMGFWVVLYFVYWKQCGYEHSYMHIFSWRHICHVYLGVELLGHRHACVCSNLADVSMHISHNHMYLWVCVNHIRHMRVPGQECWVLGFCLFLMTVRGHLRLQKVM